MGLIFRYKRKAQVSLELALAMFGVVLLFLGCINTFIWLNKVMAIRQEYYDNSRKQAASVTPRATPQEVQVDEDWLPRLRMLKTVH